MWVGAMCLTTVHGNFGETITFAGAHRLQRSWLADNCVTRAEWFRRRQTLRTEASDFFIGSENQRERLLQFCDIDAFNGGERRRDESLGVAGAPSKQLLVMFGKSQCVFPAEIVRNRIRVADQREFDRARASGLSHQINLSFAVRVGEWVLANNQTGRFTARCWVGEDRRVRWRPNRIDGNQFCECLFDSHASFGGARTSLSAERRSRSMVRASRSCGQDARAPLSPESLLQIVELIDDFFLQQVLTLRDDWFTADDHFSDGRTRRRKHNSRQEVIIRRAGN